MLTRFFTRGDTSDEPRITIREARVLAGADDGVDRYAHLIRSSEPRRRFR